MKASAWGALGLAFLCARPAGAKLPAESFWGAREFYTHRSHLRYLLLFPPGYDPRRTYELWVNLHGDPGAAGHAIFQYREEAARRGAFLLAPEAPEAVREAYIRPDGKKGFYRYWNMQSDPANVLATVDEVTRAYPIDRQRVALLGFSAGCEMGWRVLSRRPAGFCFFGGVANGFRHGRVPGGERALRRAAHRTPMFYAAGRADPFAGPWFRSTARKLRSMGFELRTAYPAGVGHALPPSIQGPLVAFLDVVRARSRPDKATGPPAGSTRHRNRAMPAAVVPLAIGGALLAVTVLLAALVRRSGTRRAQAG